MRRLLAAVLLISTAAIAYEILLMRMLSIVQWHHFAWMVISLALLGYGVSGTAIALAREHLWPRFEAAFALCALIFSIAMVACWTLAQNVPFNALQIVWDRWQLLWLGVLYLVFMVPFFFAALCIGMAFTFHGRMAGRIYFLDLLGAGLGAALVIVLLFFASPVTVLTLLSLLALAASLLVSRKRSLSWSAAAWVLLLLWSHASGMTALHLSEFKNLSKSLQAVGSTVIDETSSPLGQLTVVENRVVPVRHAPGLSIATRHLPPEQLAVFRDGGGMSAITRWDGERDVPAYIGDMTSALPYQLLDAPRVLVLGAGSGMDVLQALHLGAAEIDAVELDAGMAALVGERYSEYAGNLYQHPRVRLHIDEARGFAARSEHRYDLVQIGLLDAFAVSGSGVQALNENYLYTAESIRAYLDLLAPGGYLAITRWVKVPPRDSLKLLNTVATSLRQQGVQDPGSRIAMIRGWSTATLLVRNGELGEAEIDRITLFAQGLSFDTIHFPGMTAEQANRFNQLDRPWFHQGVQALLGPNHDAFVARYKFNIEAATDERPYFFNYFRWPVFLEALALRDRGGAALLEWGYLVPAATLMQAALAGFILILLPLVMTGMIGTGGGRIRNGAYFFLLGLAFLLVEIAFIQKFTLFLSHPLYAVAVVLAGFLVFAGIGSRLSEKLAAWSRLAGFSAIHISVCGIALLTLAYIVLLPPVFRSLLAWGDVTRICASLALIAPLALAMGMPFPLGLRSLAKANPSFIPVAWALNGFASVISAAMAVLLAVTLGFTAVLLIALVLYTSAAVLAPRP